MLLNSVIKGDSLSEITNIAIERIIENGEKSSSRNGDVTYLNNVIVELTNPMSRHLNLQGRNNNIYATIGELFWIMSGTDVIDPFLSFFLPRAKDYSDDGATWRGGYGPRIYMDNQLQNAIDVFKTDGLYTRRSIISIYDSGIDSGVETKDLPCNNLIHFLVCDGKLNMNVVSRSSDVIWGLFGINIAEWTFLQEYVAQMVGVPVGTYTHFTSNLHIYDATGKQANDVYGIFPQDLNDHIANRPCVFPEKNVKSFFTSLVALYSREIKDYSCAYYTECSIDKIFADYHVSTSGNTLYNYAQLLSYYISGKMGDRSTGFNVNEYHQELASCIRDSKFTNFIT
jgi:thymidylate synthase